MAGFQGNPIRLPVTLYLKPGFEIIEEPSRLQNNLKNFYFATKRLEKEKEKLRKEKEKLRKELEREQSRNGRGLPSESSSIWMYQKIEAVQKEKEVLLRELESSREQPRNERGPPQETFSIQMSQKMQALEEEKEELLKELESSKEQLRNEQIRLERCSIPLQKGMEVFSKDVNLHIEKINEAMEKLRANTTSVLLNCSGPAEDSNNREETEKMELKEVKMNEDEVEGLNLESDPYYGMPVLDMEPRMEYCSSSVAALEPETGEMVEQQEEGENDGVIGEPEVVERDSPPSQLIASDVITARCLSRLAFPTDAYTRPGRGGKRRHNKIRLRTVPEDLVPSVDDEFKIEDQEEDEDDEDDGDIWEPDHHGAAMITTRRSPRLAVSPHPYARSGKRRHKMVLRAGREREAT